MVERKLLSKVSEPVTFTEYMTGAFGNNEYQSDMSKLTLRVDDEVMNYLYKGRKIVKANAKEAEVIIPDVQTSIVLTGNGDTLEVEEGIAFSPVYHLASTKSLKEGSLVTCLNLRKAA